MRRLVGAYANVEGEEGWIHRWVLSAALKDESLLAILRRTAPPKSWSNTTFFALGSAMDSRIPIGVFEEIASLLPPAGPMPVLDGFMRTVQISRGRLATATARPPNLASPTVGGLFLGITGDRVDSLLLATVGAMPFADSILEDGRQCLKARLALERRETVSLDLASLRVSARCRSVLRALDAFNDGTLTDSVITRLDTIVTNGSSTTFIGFEHRLLARIYESRGDTARAVRAIQYYPRDYGGPWSATTQREAGRYFLMARDSARAIAAYEHYLELRAEAQPPLIAERDSVRALLGRLTRRVVP
jgi:hypothetical protein